ncbi:P-loop containing nucleoside triphosphate hydrolase protein [Rhizophagus clarus]|uniref:P-loop containing nucleoside triphosphate hydrolase protein n=1 Tax=Rhizophagus clarus TaxID=94130 RepID=A0A8H3QXL8_9GLOM|nr:P-loop containing nucleoside triphosphate hydrolase protein [Rhizophagus clarus]
MTRKRGNKSGSNNDGTRRRNNDGSGEGSGSNSRRNIGPRSNRGRRGGGSGGGGNGDGRPDRRFDQSRNYAPPPPKLSIPEIRQSQQETTITNFGSSELSYNGSDRLVFITNGEPIMTVWKRILKRESWDQSDVRIFVSSALVATDRRSGYEVEEVVTELGNPETGLKKLREIINFPSMSCDAGLNNNVLSFQHVVLPLLGLFTRTAITECILEKYVHAIFMVVYINLDSFLYDNVMKMLQTLVQRNSVADNNVSVERLLSRERYSFIPSSLGIFFLIIVRLLTEILRRIKEASINETMHKIANDLNSLKATYRQSLEQQQFSSTDPLTSNLETRNYFFTILEREMNIMNKMLNNGRNNLIFENPEAAKSLNTKSHYKELARKVDAERTYDPPGELSKSGRRHNNDFAEISKISIIPTNEEILCERPPFLPCTLRDSLHFLPDGLTRLLDIQFRLLREDLLNPIRVGLSNLLTALLQEYSTTDNDIKLSKELKKIQDGGGRFSYNNGVNENGDLQVYTGIRFANIVCDRRKGFACTIRFTPPRISARDAKGRREYWERSKKLLTGSLVTLILPNQNSKKVNSDDPNNGNTASISNSDLYLLYFGVVVSRDEKVLSKDINSAEIDINFIDPSIYPIALSEISNYNKTKKRSLEKRFMVESTGVYLESYYHILKTLQTTDPSSLPFEKYLTPNFDMNNDDGDKGKMKEGTNSTLDIKVENPMYTRAPGFHFDLSILCKNQYNLQLNVADENTHDELAKNIVKHSNIGKLPNGTPYGLDETQAKALISSLTREIALVEGPPGTGKTVVGVQIMKVLLAEENRKTNIGPILTICFTNHALDQFLEHLLDENITNIVRLGSRSKSEKVKDFNLEEVCRNRARTKKESYLLAKLYEEIDKIEERTKKIKNTLFNRWMKWRDISEYLMIEERGFYDKFTHITEYDLPSWVLGTDDEEGFQTVNKNNRQKKKYPFEEWVKGNDITVIKARRELLLNPPKSDKMIIQRDTNLYELLREEEEEDKMDTSEDESQIDHNTIEWINNYDEPKTNRPLDVLLNDHSIWRMSILERQKLHDHWRTKIYKEIVAELSELQEKHENKIKEMNEIYDEARRQVLLGSDVVGMTTNGAAKFQKLIRSIGPRIIICEEAGEVLEAHILSALTPSTQHLILIGDHKQLRPHIATYSLSMDSSTGKNYQLDKSLFERLVYGDKAVKIEKIRLLTQRRMRKEISDLIRYNDKLYPNLIDGDNTTKYEDVRGAQHNVYFIDHSNPEDNSGGEYAIKSHVNRYEVKMVVEMVKYFVRNGYTKPDDIAVLTPYLGQMIKIRDALAKSFVVVIDERDALNITEMEEQQEQGETNNNNIETISVASKKSLNQQVTLRTVDNFQGEEANIIIVSLVRNFSKSGGHESIGFLKSLNRSNVLLSRARKGMYLIGNSELMAMKSQDLWTPVINILRERNQVGFGMPIVCNKHPNYKNTIVDPDQFEQVSPDGGCYENCNMSLPCGHICKYKCHSDDPEHIGVKCNEPCSRLHPECNHPCPKRCSDNCGECEFLIGDIILPGCDHILKNAKCWQDRAKDSLRCKTLVSKKLPHCEHYKDVYCFESVDDIICTEQCKKQLECGHECLNKCYECQNLSKPKEESNDEETKEETNIIGPIERTRHWKCLTVCDRLLFCGHICKSYCHEGSDCPPCKNKCTVICKHTSCHKPCLEPCAVCAEKCLWECQHQGRCNLSCGAPCYRLPCNKRCNKVLKCGHNCAGVCGEICPSQDFCVECAPDNVKNQVSDMILNCAFSEIDWEEERMIVLTCGHVYTMETMDMHMEMKNYYEGSVEGEWTSVKILPTTPMNMKTCPACRTPIKNVRRYGRIINKCTLDIQNKKFLAKYDLRIKEISKTINSLKDRMNNKRNTLKNILPKLKSRPTEVVFEEYIINEKLPEITPPDYFGNIKMYHGFDKNNEKAWIIHVSKLLYCYRILISIIEEAKLPPHKKAFEAAVSSLYQAKLAKEDCENDLVEKLLNFQISDNPSSSLDYSLPNMNTIKSTPTETFKETLSEVGISIPQVDCRIYLDAFFEIINIQKFLHHEILFIIQELSKESTPSGITIENTLNIKEVWMKFIEKLQLSIKNHLNTIRETAESTHYGRHLLLADVEISDFDLKLLKYQLRFPPDGNNIVSRALQKRITEKCEDIKKCIADIIESQRFKNSDEEFRNSIRTRLVSLLENCNEVEECAVNLSRKLSTEEKLEIYRAMKSEFNSSGHWYECPNGHPYTIGECGRAMQLSRIRLYVLIDP